MKQMKYKKQIQLIAAIVTLIVFPVITFYLMEAYTHNPFEEVRPWAQFFNIVLFELLAVAGVGGGGQVRLGEDLQPLKGIGGKVDGLAGRQPVFQVGADVQYSNIPSCFLPGAVVWAKRAFEPLAGRVHVRSPL